MTELTGKRILVLEDEVLLALDAAEALECMGAEVIGPVHRVERALQLLESTKPDAALLDVNIHGETSADVAKRLVAENIPFVLATGYGTQSGISGSVTTIDKPYTPAQIQAAFRTVFSSAASA